MAQADKLRPLVIGHKGAIHLAPENTLASFRAALELGVDGVEFDCYLCRDGHPVVIHDATVDRTTNGQGRVRASTLEELKRLDASSWFDPRFAKERIPTLAEVLDLLAPSGVLINIEIKSDYHPSAFSGELPLTSKVLQEVKERGLLERVLISSFNPLVLWQVQRLMPGVKIALNYQRDMPFFLGRGWPIPLLRPYALHPEQAMVTSKYVRWAKAQGFRVNVWTPGQPSEMRRLLVLGLDGVITDRLDVLRQVMAETLGI